MIKNNNKRKLQSKQVHKIINSGLELINYYYLVINILKS